MDDNVDPREPRVLYRDTALDAALARAEKAEAAVTHRLEHLTTTAEQAVRACRDDGHSYPHDPTMKILEAVAGVARAELRSNTAAKALLEHLAKLEAADDVNQGA
jgi:hypothetical protein